MFYRKFHCLHDRITDSGVFVSGISMPHDKDNGSDNKYDWFIYTYK